MEIETRPDELYHFGRKGMKWYQNIFTKGKTGSKRRKTSRTDQGEDGESSGTKSKSHKDMTDDELRKETDRLNLEANYISAKSRANPPSSQQSTKDNFTKKFINEAVKPALIAAGRKQIENYLNTEIEKLTKGKVKPDEIETLKKMSEKQGFKTKIAENTQKMMEANKKIKEYQDAEKTAKDKADRKAAIQKEVDDYNNSGHERDSVRSNTYAQKGEDITDRYTPTGKESKNRPRLETVERFEATGKDIVGEGTSRYTKRDSGPVRDVVYDGRRYVEQLLQLEDTRR